MNAKGWTPTLRYAPRNGIIVDWGIAGVPFSLCGMPECLPATETPPTTPAAMCAPEFIMPAISTYNWLHWVPEIIAGFMDMSDELAASYARRAAIEFAQKSRALRRLIAVELQPGVARYPVFPFEGESVQGVIKIESAMGECSCGDLAGLGKVNIGVVHFNVAQQEIVIQPNGKSCGCHTGSDFGPKHLLITVWVSPTEDSCDHDAYLWEQYRSDITKGARASFIEEVTAVGSYKTNKGYNSYKGDALIFNRADKLAAQFKEAIRKARTAEDMQGHLQTSPPGSPFNAGCCGFGVRR